LLRTETAALGWLILVRCEPFFSWARSGFTAMAAAADSWLRPRSARRGAAARRSGSGRHGGPRGRDRSADGLGWLGPTMAWLRPALAVAGAVVIVVAGVFAVQEAKNMVVSPAANSRGTGGNQNSGGQPGSHHKNGGSLQSSGTAGPGHRPTHQPTTNPAAKGKATPSPSCSSAPTPSTSPTPTPTTTSPTPTPTTTSPTPTPTTTSPSPTAPAGGATGTGAGAETNDFAAVPFRAGNSPRGHVVLVSCPSPSSSSGGPTG
jgi:hypothetical protein